MLIAHFCDRSLGFQETSSNFSKGCVEVIMFLEGSSMPLFVVSYESS